MTETDAVLAILSRHGVSAEEAVNDSKCFEELYEYYVDIMPYGTAKARTGDPCQWIAERLEWVVSTERA